MENHTEIALLGGDARMLYCAGMLEETGSTVHLFGFENEPAVRGNCVSAEEAVARARVVVLPMPVSRDRAHLLAPLTRQPVESRKATIALSRAPRQASRRRSRSTSEYGSRTTFATLMGARFAQGLTGSSPSL